MQPSKIALASAARHQNGAEGPSGQTTESLGLARGLDETAARPARPTSGKRMVVDTSSDESDFAEPSRERKSGAANGNPCSSRARHGAEVPSGFGGTSAGPQQPGSGRAVNGGEGTPISRWHNRGGVEKNGAVGGRASKRQAVAFWAEQSEGEAQGAGRRQEGMKGGEAFKREGNRGADRTSNGHSRKVRKAGLLSPD